MSWSRRIKMFLLAGAILFICMFYLYALPHLSFNKCLIDQLRYAQILENRQELMINPVENIRFNDTPLFYDKEMNVYCFSIDTDFRAVDPTISISGGAKISIAIFGGEITKESVRENVRHHMIFYTDHSFYKADLVVTALPIVSIQTQNSIDADEEPIGLYETALELTVYDNRPEATHTERLHILQASAHMRGDSSLYYPQKSYRIQLLRESMGLNIRNNPTSFLGMTGDDDWIMYAPYNDPEKIRNTFSTNLWRQWAGNNNEWKMDITTEGQFVELFMNGRYWGIYTLMRPVTAKHLGLQENEDLQKSDYLYRSISYVDTGTKDFQDAADSVVAGRYELRFPKTEINDYLKWAPLDRLNQIIFGSDRKIEEMLFQVLSMDNTIDYYLFINLTAAVDNLGKNQLYIARNEGGNYRILVMPWDLDQTFGMMWAPENNKLITDVIIGPEYPLQNVNAMQVCIEMDVDGICEKIKTRYTQLREGLLSNASLTVLLDSYETEVFGSGAALRNAERWPESANAENMGTIREWTLTRLEVLDRLIETLGEE